ncbi:hypothetical protein MGYG_05721 [Nannizzia gypsea CBS 118893]|uniref:Uncharacterized protein n=1 Tax=Arthroderma gypseum (strain ATCC MYA-4604 / CBS 118893) TaxID=535722 RepID=E4UXI9_ARTGP|nr:hypothetical protein MGYG_05721 [Nannizzia gypsea CBS 118893]EFR02723.1 hypothetical protein MGYG_05721 [Nannizzia gypsea CBS 118893]
MQCFFYADNGIFLQCTRGAILMGTQQLSLPIAPLDVTLFSRIQNKHTRDLQSSVVTKVEKLESLPLRKEWMNDLAQAVAFLESLNLAHDFGCTEKSERILKLAWDHMEEYLTAMNRTKVEVEVPVSLVLEPNNSPWVFYTTSQTTVLRFMVIDVLPKILKEHGRKVVELLQNMEFPKLDGDPLIDEIISKCWHNNYTTIAELAAYTETLGRNNRRKTETEKTSPLQWRAVIGRIIRGLWKRFRSLWDFVLCRSSQTNLK